MATDDTTTRDERRAQTRAVDATLRRAVTRPLEDRVRAAGVRLDDARHVVAEASAAGVGYGPAPTSSTRALEDALDPPDVVVEAPAIEVTRRFRRRFSQRVRRYLVRHPGCTEADAASALFAADPVLYEAYRALAVKVVESPTWYAVRELAVGRAAARVHAEREADRSTLEDDLTEREADLVQEVTRRQRLEARRAFQDAARKRVSKNKRSSRTPDVTEDITQARDQIVQARGRLTIEAVLDQLRANGGRFVEPEVTPRTKREHERRWFRLPCGDDITVGALRKRLDRLAQDRGR